MGTNYNVMGRILVLRVNNSFQSQLAGGGYAVPTIYDIFAVNDNNRLLCHSWLRRLDRNLRGWFTVLKSFKFSLPAAPTPGGLLTTTLATQQTNRYKNYHISVPMKYKLEFPENEQNVGTSAPYGGSLTYSNAVPLNAKFYVMIHVDASMDFMYNYRHFFNDLQ